MNIPHDISQYNHHFKDYTELRVQENRVARISLTNGDVTGNVSSAQSGVSARVFKDGNWGFSSAPEFNEDSVGRVVKSSTENVRFMNLKDTSRCGLILPDTMAEYEMDFSTKKPENCGESMNRILIHQKLREIFPYRCLQPLHFLRAARGISFPNSHLLLGQNPPSISDFHEVF